MKFRKIQFIDHPILGNCLFDFTNEQGDTVDTIIIAGENGCGKSVLLNELFNYNPSNLYENKLGKINTEIELNSNELSKLKAAPNFTRQVYNGLSGNTISVKQDFSIPPSWEQSKVSFKDNGSNQVNLYGDIFYPTENNLFKSLFSDVEINFTPKNIASVTSSNIDEIKSGPIKSNSNIATEITQLLIDVDNLDNADLARWVSEHPGEAPTTEVQRIRMKRFTNAFHSIFPHKRFVNIKNKDGHKEVLFKEFGKKMSIDKLSSGEKQIVFRGGFLLKDKKSTEGAFVLVDEPEISLHPKWQLEILSFLKALFTNDSGIQTSQIIIATHSPFIIHNCTRNKDKVIVLQKDTNGVISVSNTPKYYSWSSDQLVEKAFNISHKLSSLKITVFVEGETDEKYYKRALEVFNYTDSKLDFQWIGINIEKGKAENTGDTALNNAYIFFKANMTAIPNKVVLLYDSDTNKPDNKLEEKLFVHKMANNEENTLYKKGIENLLKLPENFNKDDYYKKNERIDEYGAKSIKSKLDKTKLCDYLCGLPKGELSAIFSNLKLEIDAIENIIQT